MDELSIYTAFLALHYFCCSARAMIDEDEIFPIFYAFRPQKHKFLLSKNTRQQMPLQEQATISRISPDMPEKIVEKVLADK